MLIFRRVFLSSVILILLSGVVYSAGKSRKPVKPATANPPIYIAFLWHMHQPIYWPYESPIVTDQNNRFSFSVVSVFDQRIGPYTNWPSNAIWMGANAGLAHFGAQVNLSGSLIENLNFLQSGGDGNFSGWATSWNNIRNAKTSLGNPRLDLVDFGYYHPLLALVDSTDITRQIEQHRQIVSTYLPGPASKGIFPTENAFSEREIPALTHEGIQWAIVDNIHFDRACTGYPYSTAGNIYEPNKADQRNPNPNDWVGLNDVWDPTQNSARWGRQPHYVEYTDPSSGAIKKMIAVPGDRYLGVEDGRGGFGALDYQAVMSQLAPYNTDPNHPIIIVLAHDGDNYGGGSDSYYNSNFQSFVNWLLANPSQYVCTTIQDYLDQFPPDTNDVIHAEDGSWSGADNGDPEFLEWDADPVNGYSYDRNSWGIVTAAKNIVYTANQINPNDPNMANAWKYYNVSLSSDYWYWDGQLVWDSNPARACNQAVSSAMPVISGGTDQTPPTIFLPGREPYNPGGTEWGINQPNTFSVWTYAYDVSGLQSVNVLYRTTANGSSTVTSDNETYVGGSTVSGWTSVPMSGTAIASQTDPLPTYKALEYSAQIAGLTNVLVDYYVEAVDNYNNVGRSAIQHVWVGQNVSSSTSGVSWTPTAPTINDSIKITVAGATQSANLHWGVNYSGSTWQQPNSVYWPPSSTLFNGTGPAIETPMIGPDSNKLTITMYPFNNAAQSVQSLAFVIHYSNNTYDNNSGANYDITISGSSAVHSFTMDGVLDSAAQLVASNAGVNLYVGWNGANLYVASQSAPSQGGDVFIFVSDSARPLVTAMWAKAGEVSQWSAYLGNESTNNWSGWYNSADAQFTNGVQNASGTVVEGTINLPTIYGHIPPVIYLAVAKYQTQDGGTLMAQVPAGNGDGNVGPNELYQYSYSSAAALPGIPALVSPANNAVNQPVPIILKWNRAQGATTYRLQVATNQTFTSGIVLDDSVLTDTSLTDSGLALSTGYYWRVNAKNTTGTSGWSGSRMFTTIGQSPAQVALVSPANNSINQPVSLLLVWNSTQGAATYRVQVDTNQTFATGIAFDDSALTDTSTTVSGLANSTNYYWRVDAKNVAGTGVWSATRMFTTIIQAPSQVILLAPADRAIFDTNVVNLLWQTSQPAVTTYWAENALDSSFASKTVDSTLTDTAATVTNLLYGQKYWWRVRAMNAGGWGSFSVPNNYSIAANASGIVSMQIAVQPRWNMLSAPLTVANDSAAAVFPGAQGSAYAFQDGSYVAQPVLSYGDGYWLKFTSAQTESVSGYPRLYETVDVAQGWNLIGTGSAGFIADSVTSTPDSILASKFFGYSSNYQTVDSLMPGRAYWIKVSQPGQLVVGHASATGKIVPRTVRRK